MQSAAVIVILMLCSIWLLIWYVPFFKYFDYRITKKWVIITFFGLLYKKYYSKAWESANCYCH
jgi:hypothetical protein